MTAGPDALVALEAARRRAADLRSGTGFTARSRRLVVVLASLAAVDQVISVFLAILGPEIGAALGISTSSYGMIVAQRANAAAGVALQFAFHLHHRPRHRRLLLLQAAFSTAVGIAAAAFTGSFWPLLLAVGATAPTAGIAWAVHRPMLMDAHSPAEQVGAVVRYQMGFVVGAAMAPVALVGLTDGLGLSWRGALVVAAALALVAAVVATRVVDPTTGAHDEAPLRAAIRASIHAPEDASATPNDLAFGDALRRVWSIPSLPRLLGAWAVLGVVLSPLLTYLSAFGHDVLGLGVRDRSLFLAGAWGLAVPVLVLLHRRARWLAVGGPQAFASSSAGAFALLAASLVLIAASSSFGVALLGAGLALATTSALVALLSLLTYSVVPAAQRSLAGGLVAFFLFVVGGQGGSMVLGGLNLRFGPQVAIALLAVPALVAARLVSRVSTVADADQDALVNDLVEEEVVGALVRGGAHLPLLACRQIDFGYQHLQVLFGVDFTVDDGEMVALLGTNGAGKSTLLRVIAGLGVPTRGSVRLEGRDVTFLGADKRAGLGIAQVPGGRAVFPTLSVVENLRTFGYSHGRDRRRVDAGIAAALEAFPRLGERRNLPASTLSGGEQQMLGLAGAFVVKPRLLLIDELSLGLAPKVVGELLAMVRQINAGGTAIVLVEQSVNIALSLVDHAYFMEKGEVRFDGPSRELLDRGDLLRAVFLDGGAAATGATAATPATPATSRGGPAR